MAISTKLRIFKAGEALRTLTMPDQDVNWDDKAEVSYVDSQDATKADKSNVLELDNTTPFIPDTDYEPSTKKYVDDGLLAKKDDFTENTAFNKNFETLATEIKENGTQAVGVSNNIPRADHVHPKDNTKADKLFTINTQTGTTYTLALTDAGGIIEMNNASPNTITIPTNASVAFAVGTRLDIVQYGVGLTTMQGDTGVTVNGVSAGSEVLSGQYEGVTIYKRATNEWVIINK